MQRSTPGETRRTALVGRSGLASTHALSAPILDEEPQLRASAPEALSRPDRAQRERAARGIAARPPAGGPGRSALGGGDAQVARASAES